MKIQIYKGQSMTVRVTARNMDSGARMSLTGATLEFQVKAKAGDPDPALISKSIGSGITLLDQTSAATAGEFDVQLAPADTSAMPAGLYEYDVVMTIGDTRTYLVPPAAFEIREVVNAYGP